MLRNQSCIILLGALVEGAVAGGYAVYAAIKVAVGLRLDPEEAFNGADLTTHKISAAPDRESGW